MPKFMKKFLNVALAIVMIVTQSPLGAMINHYSPVKVSLPNIDSVYAQTCGGTPQAFCTPEQTSGYCTRNGSACVDVGG